MYKEHHNVQYQGFHPTEPTQLFIQERLDAISDQAPYGSTISAAIKRKDGVFKAVWSIHSSAGKFFAIAADANLHETIVKATEQLRKKLQKWKGKRFHSDQKTILRRVKRNQKDENSIAGGISHEESVA